MSPLALKPTDSATDAEIEAESAGDPIVEEDRARRVQLKNLVEVLFAKISELLPAVPVDDDLQKDPELPSLQLSHLECLLYSFHSIAKKIKPAALDDELVLKVIFFLIGKTKRACLVNVVTRE